MKKSNVFFLLSLCGSAYAGNQETSTPNIILIMADDLGWGDVGFNGNNQILTPNLDQLASEGTVFENFYAAAPLSSPTRASVLTGRNAYRTGVFAPNVGILRPEEKTIPEWLKEKGYTTGIFGKWHLGTLTYNEVDANRGRPENKHLFNPPTEHGFDDAFVTESKVPTFNPMSAPLSNNGRFWNYQSENEKSKPYGTYYWDKNGNKVIEGLQGDDSRIIIDRTIPFIDKAIEQNKPFFATVWFHTPHLPCVAGPEHAALYPNLSKEEINYFGSITAMDEQIGRLIKFLKIKDIYNNTIILFCSDNGPELNTPGSAGKFKGKKRSLYEGGIKVPAFIVGGNKKYPKKIKQPCSTTDYFPTILEMVGIFEFPDYSLDGESFLPFLKSDKKKRKKPLVFCSGKQGAVITNTHKLYYHMGKLELYNLEIDPYEQNDISKSYVKKVENLSNYLFEQMESYRRSFNGDEYGKASVVRIKQKWEGITSQ